MSQEFFQSPILNSPYKKPEQHWQLNERGQPTHVINHGRRLKTLVSPIPKSRKNRDEAGREQGDFLVDESGQEYHHTGVIEDIRSAVESWRGLPENQWHVTSETRRLLKHWRTYSFTKQTPFFCQIDAVETVIWLAEVAPRNSSQGKRYWEHLRAVNAEANPELLRMALKLATGAGKTTVMAMLIAWQTVNAVRNPKDKRFSRGFLIVAPGITIKDRLRVLQPDDPDSYYQSRELVPREMLADINKARIVITNYHAFKKRDEMPLNKVQHMALRTEPKPESDRAMIRRVAGKLMKLKQIIVINDEAHHCYREREMTAEEAAAAQLKGEDKAEAEQNNEAARLWISGLEAVSRELGISMVYDLSATPFFLRGSGYREGTLFGWVMNDFSLMDAIECGIVKLPRVPILDNTDVGDKPMLRNLWEHVGKDLPKSGRGRNKSLNPQRLPTKLLTALDALYGNYKKTQELWRENNMAVDPVFIIVCNNTATSKLIYDYISGYYVKDGAGEDLLMAGKYELFRNHGAGADGRMRTLLIDSKQLESGDAISGEFRRAVSPQIENFKRELIRRKGHQAEAEIDDGVLLREVMNTVGQKGKLGESIRCVVSVSMLTEGWDVSTVTHILGVRAFGTQLLCEQVIGRALRRQSYKLNADTKLFDVEYADVFGVPFDFTAEAVISVPKPPKQVLRVHALSPDRDKSEIRFPRVEGYRKELPQDIITAKFSADSTLDLTPEIVGATETTNSGIVGATTIFDVKHLETMREATVCWNLAHSILTRHWLKDGQLPTAGLLMQMRVIVADWMEQHLRCQGKTQKAQLLYGNIADMAAGRIMQAITRGQTESNRVIALLDPYNREGSTRYVDFGTSQNTYATGELCHINYAVLDSDWEAEFCRIVDFHPSVLAWVKNHGLDFEVPYLSSGEEHRYRPDFIVRIDDGRGAEDPLNLVVEIKGQRDETDKDKAETMRAYWVPGVNALGTQGRWDFVEFTDRWEIDSDFHALVSRLRDTSNQNQSDNNQSTRG